MMPKPEQIEATIVAPASILESSFNYSFRRTAELKNKGQKEALPQKCKVSLRRPRKAAEHTVSPEGVNLQKLGPE